MDANLSLSLGAETETGALEVLGNLQGSGRAESHCKVTDPEHKQWPYYSLGFWRPRITDTTGTRVSHHYALYCLCLLSCVSNDSAGLPLNVFLECLPLWLRPNQGMGKPPGGGISWAELRVWK